MAFRSSVIVEREFFVDVCVSGQDYWYLCSIARAGCRRFHHQSHLVVG